MKFRPLHDRVVIRRIEGEDKTKGGIIIPDTVKEKPQEGEVIAVGPGARDGRGKLGTLRLNACDRGPNRYEEKGGLTPPVLSSRTMDLTIMSAKDVRFSSDARDRML